VKARAGLAIVLLLGLGLTGLARAEIVQRGHLRIAFDGELTPRKLPRSGAAPVKVSFEVKITTTGGADPPQLRRIAIAINGNGSLDPTGLPVCRIEQIQPATTASALEACRRSLVGEGRFSANVLLPEQAPFPSAGKIIVFNSTFDGKPAILAHVYGVEPAPTSYTLPFQISRIKGTYGTLLSASLPNFTSDWGYVTGLSISLGRAFSHRGRRHSYLSAGCPAPAGFPAATFSLARGRFGFAGKTVTSTLVRSCTVR
jgi:hypothetical protein